MISGKYCEEKRRIMIEFIISELEILKDRMDKLEAPQK